MFPAFHSTRFLNYEYDGYETCYSHWEAGVQSPTGHSPSTVTLETAAEMAEPPNERTLDAWVTICIGAALEHHLTFLGSCNRKT